MLGSEWQRYLYLESQERERFLWGLEIQNLVDVNGDDELRSRCLKSKEFGDAGQKGEESFLDYRPKKLGK